MNAVASGHQPGGQDVEEEDCDIKDPDPVRPRLCVLVFDKKD
jgi:hypothetical protein